MISSELDPPTGPGITLWNKSTYPAHVSSVRGKVCQEGRR